MRSTRRHRFVFGLVVAAASIAWSEPGMAGAVIFSGSSAMSGSGTLMIGVGTAQIGRTGVTIQFGNGSAAAPTGPSSTGSSGASGSPWAPTYGNGTNAPLNLSGSSEGSSSGGSGSSGGGLVWGEPLTADVATFGKVHTNLRYFSQTGYNGTQQAVGVNFTLRY